MLLYSFFYPEADRHHVATHLPLVVVDQDHSPMSHALLRKLDAALDVHMSGVVGSIEKACAVVELDKDQCDGQAQSDGRAVAGSVSGAY